MWEKPAALLKVGLRHECFSCFLNCTNGIKSGKASQIFSVTLQQRFTFHDYITCTNFAENFADASVCHVFC